MLFAFVADAGAAVQCSLDSDIAFGPCSGGGEDPRDGLADGPHTFRVRTIDALGNTATIVRSFVIDTIAPALRLTGGPTKDGTIDSRTAEFSFESEAGAALTCRVDGGGFRACSGNGVDRLTRLADGGHKFAVRAADVAGNATVVERPFKVNAPGGKLLALVRHRWSRIGRNTRVRTLEVRELPAGATVTVACKGRGCPAGKPATLRPRRGAVLLTGRFRGRLLAPGTLITVRAAAPGYFAKTVRFTARRGDIPRVKTTYAKRLPR